MSREHGINLCCLKPLWFCLAAYFSLLQLIQCWKLIISHGLPGVDSQPWNRRVYAFLTFQSNLRSKILHLHPYQLHEIPNLVHSCSHWGMSILRNCSFCSWKITCINLLKILVSSYSIQEIVLGWSTSCWMVQSQQEPIPLKGKKTSINKHNKECQHVYLVFSNVSLRKLS